MIYGCQLNSSQQLYLENRDSQTIVTLFSSSAGQQQQASSSFQTGTWTAPPQAFQSASGAVVQIQGANGNRWIQIQGGSLQVGERPLHFEQPLPMQPISSAPTLPPMQPMQPMPPMKPMPPMQMGNMSMSLNPMTMRMGNLEMQMGSAESSAGSSVTGGYCSQCGSAVQPDDRFCAHCGTQLLRS